MTYLMKTASKYARGLTLLLLCLAVWAPSARSAEGPMSLLEKSVNQILEILENDALQSEARREQISELVRQRFDFETMSQHVLGPQWRNTSPADKDRFISLFSDLLEASYVGKIEDYNNEQVSFSKEQVDGRKARVDTLVLTGTNEIPIEYRLVNRNDSWLVYDVIIEGVSLVRSYRDNYREIVRKEGMDGLLAKMQDKLAEIRQGETAG